MNIDPESFFIDSDFIHATDEFLSGIVPYSGISPADRFVNFLGVMTSTEFMRLMKPELYELEKKERHVSTRPFSIINGEQYFETGSVYAAIKEATQKFTMIELGGGWGARSVMANAILKKIRSLDEYYVIVEAMEDHCKWIKEHMMNNGINYTLHSIIHAAVWVDNRPQIFPDTKGALGQSVPIKIPDFVEGLSDEEAKSALLNLVKKGRLGISEEFESGHGKSTRDWALVSSVTLRDLLMPLNKVDYLDIDIQGAERVIFKRGVDLLEKKVKRVHIGTHGKMIHEDLVKLFTCLGWQIVVQIPPSGKFKTQWGDFQTWDGIISAVNNNLR